jgi:hypothetical protein
MIQAKRCEVEEAVSVAELACQRLSENCPYAFYFREIHCEFANGILTVRGRLPTFYLMQVLQSRLGMLEHVQEIRNEVDVVNAAGLSSVRE